MFQHVGKLLPLAFSILALVCLAVVFVNLTNFPELGNLHLRRSLSIAGVDGPDVADKASSETNSAVNSASIAIIYASDATETAVSQVTDKVQSLSDEISAQLPDFYSVGLWGYCQGQKEDTAYSNCSQPSTSFSFDLLSILGSVSSGIDEVLPDKNRKVLAGYHDVSQWSISAYILGFVSTFIAVIFGVTTMFFSRGKTLLIISSLTATVFVTGASIGVTIIYGLITGAIQSILHPLGADASFGAH
ncbi:unnamed protein product [Penicillium salamii]|nr:unnamed protein product [Penicillium salamii]